MSTDAVRTAARMLAVAEAGGTAGAALVVGGPSEVVGRRLLVVRDAGGAEEVEGDLGSPALQEAALSAVRAALDDPRASGGTTTLTTGTDAGGAEVELYVEVRRPVRDLVVVGAGHIAQPMSRLGALLGYQVFVVDDRPDFATRERFPEAHRLIRADFSDPFADVPIHPRSHVLLVTRGHKYDYECLVRLLRMDPGAAYVGMIGSRRRVRATYAQLLDDGISRDQLDRIHAPVGLDLGAETPEEIAVAVAAELVLVHRGGSGRPLRDVERVATRFFPERAP